MPNRKLDGTGGPQPISIRLVIVIINYCAVCLISASLLLIIAAVYRDGADVVRRVVADVSRGDIIALISQR